MKHVRTFCLSSFILLGFGLLARKATAQQQTGRVVEAQSGSPLSGATISDKSAGSGTISGDDGSFRLAATKGDSLIISLIGYQPQRIVYDGRKSLVVRLSQSAHQLSQLVIVGYGEQSRATITTAISQLDQDVLKNAPRANLGSALQGTLPGLNVVNTTGQPGASPSILLRGGASINSPGAPLVVVDGIIRPFNDLPSEDIASIQLLKDAAATAIYGARANNGVLLITTKKGQQGKARITYKYTTGFNTAREGYQFLDAKDFIYYNRLGNLNSGRTLDQVNSSMGYGLKTDAADLASFDIRSYGPNTSYLMADGWDTVGDPYGGTIIFKDHGGELADILFRNTQTQDHYISVSGGNEKGTYYSSFDYYKEDGVIVGSSYKRFSGDVNGSYKIKPNLEIGSGVTASTSSQYGVNGSEINTMYRGLALWPTFNPWLDSAKTQPNPGNSATDGNPLYWLSKLDRSNEVNQVTINANVKWDIIPGLFVKATGSGYLKENLNESFQKATQTYSQMFADPPSTGNTTRQSTTAFLRTFQQQYNVLANYTKSFGRHDLNAMVGTEYYDTRALTMQVLGMQAPTDDISTANASTVFNPNNSSDPNNPNNNYTFKTDYRIISTFGRLNYDYDQRYLISLDFRRDGVSSLSTQNHFGFFPGLSVGWNLQKEKFFSGSGISRIVSTFKPRASYGVNGNVAGLGDYEVQGVYGLQGQYYGNSGFLNTGIINSNLRWEKSKTMDVGLDIGFLNDRITAVMDYYNRKTSDLLTNLPLPSYTGFNTVRTNLGTLQNQGYEISVTANIIRQPSGFSWDVSGNASYNQNKILKLPYNGQPNNRQGGFQVYDPKTQKVVWVGGYQEGHALGDVYAFKQVSIFKDQAEIDKLAANRVDVVADISGPNSNYGAGKITPGDVNWMDVDHNDTIDTRDQVYIGNITPKWTGGFSTTLSYKGFNLYSRFQFALGYVIYNDYVARILGNFQGTLNYIDWQTRSWSPSNEITDIPKVYYADQVAAPLGKKNYVRANSALPSTDPNGYNSRFYENGGYLACREITLSYDFPESMLAKTRVLSSSRIYASMNNLFYITKFSGPTPEPPADGVYQGTYPTPRSVVLGVQVSF